MMKVNVSDNDVEQSTELLDDDFLQLLLTHNWPVVAQADVRGTEWGFCVIWGIIRCQCLLVLCEMNGLAA